MKFAALLVLAFVSFGNAVTIKSLVEQDQPCEELGCNTSPCARSLIDNNGECPGGSKYVPIDGEDPDVVPSSTEPSATSNN